MRNFEKLTGFIVAIGTLLTAAANLYKEYNIDKQKTK